MRVKLKHNAYNYVITSYVLSPNGRIELRKKYQGIKTEPPFIFPFCAPIESLYKERISFERKKVPILNEIVQDKDSEAPNDINDISEPYEDAQDDFEKLEKTLDDPTFEMPQKLNLEYEKYYAIPFADRIDDDIYKNIYHVAKNELLQLGSKFDLSDEYIESKLDTYLFANPLQLDFLKYSMYIQSDFWREAFCYGEEWEDFADLALRFACSFGSEAMVERYLSIQRYIQNSRMTNVSTPMVKARLQLHEINNVNKNDNKK